MGISLKGPCKEKRCPPESLIPLLGNYVEEGTSIKSAGGTGGETGNKDPLRERYGRGILRFRGALPLERGICFDYSLSNRGGRENTDNPGGLKAFSCW
jgi:hypothetical protein